MKIINKKSKLNLYTIIKYVTLPAILILIVLLYKVFKSIFNIDESNELDYNIGYLSFSGTIIVASVSLYISIINFIITNKRIDNEKFISSQPRFNIEVSEKFVAPYFEGNNSTPNSTLIIIENLSENIAMDVFFMDSLYAKKLGKNEKIKIVIPYWEENEKRFCGNIYKYYFLNDDECVDSILKDILIQYQDVYDNDVVQYFNLVKIDGQYIYVKRTTKKV